SPPPLASTNSTSVKFFGARFRLHHHAPPAITPTATKAMGTAYAAGFTEEEEDEDEESATEEVGEDEDENTLVCLDLKVKLYKRPQRLESDRPMVDTQTVQTRWRSFQDAKTEQVAITAFARLAVVSTNILEGVLCFTHLIPVLKDPSFYTESFIKDISTEILEDNNINWYMEDGDRFAYLTPRGTYRRAPCFVLRGSKGYETHFCPWRELAAEMEWYVQNAQTNAAIDQLESLIDDTQARQLESSLPSTLSPMEEAVAAAKSSVAELGNLR
ncbi:hypothetical protein HK104_003202, partial [Borealophlyctis nickersoniae]